MPGPDRRLEGCRLNDYTTVADIYDAYVTDTRDHAFWARWGARASAPILEVTAGSGRATVALASAGTKPVVALDLAPAMLERLVDRVRGTRLPVQAVAGDMTRLPFSPERFGLVVIPFNSFAELVEAPEREAALNEMHRVLVPGGRAIVTLHDPVRRRQTLDGEVRRLGPFQVGDRRLDLFVQGRSLGTDLAESQQTYRLTSAGGQLLEERRQTVRFALPDAASLLAAAAKAGLEARALFGNYDESPYVAGQGPFIIAVLGRVARAAAGAAAAERG